MDSILFDVAIFIDLASNDTLRAAVVRNGERNAQRGSASGPRCALQPGNGHYTLYDGAGLSTTPDTRVPVSYVGSASVIRGATATTLGYGTQTVIPFALALAVYENIADAICSRLPIIISSYFVILNHLSFRPLSPLTSVYYISSLTLLFSLPPFFVFRVVLIRPADRPLLDSG